VTCRTVSTERHEQVCPDFPVFTLAGLEQPQQHAFIGTYFRREARPNAATGQSNNPEDPCASALIEQLNRTPLMTPLVANPLLLSIICFVVDGPQGVTLPTTRGVLYEKALERLLARPPRVEVSWPNQESA